MVQGPSIAALEALRNTSASIDEKIALLKQLKNDIVGHEQRKELVVKHGAVEPLVGILNSITSTAFGNKVGQGRLVYSEDDGWSAEDEARLQATLILGSLANGGVAFMQPLLAAGLPECMLSALAIEKKPRLLVAILQTMRSLAAQSSAASMSDVVLNIGLVDHRSLAALNHILCTLLCTQSPGKQLFRLVTDVITAVAVDEETRTKIVDSPLWSTLIFLFVNAAAGIVDGLDRTAAGQLQLSPPREHLDKLLCAIAAVAAGSNFRAESFIHHPGMRSLLKQNAQTEALGLSSPAHRLIPDVFVAAFKSVSFNGGSAVFPSLTSLQPGSGTGTSGVTGRLPQSMDMDHANAVCALLLYFARTEMVGVGRLATLRLLASVNNATEAHSLLVALSADQLQQARERERQLYLLAVPLLISTLDDVIPDPHLTPTEQEYQSMRAEQENHREIKPQVCEVLALLVQSNRNLQLAAVAGEAVRKVVPLLKKSFDNVIPAKPAWSPRSNASSNGAQSETTQLGRRGLSPELLHALRCRQASLEAIASIARTDDECRQTILEQDGVTTYIIESMKPFPQDERLGHQLTPKDGNTTPVILAACHAAQCVSRSVKTLRTNMVDAGVAAPINDLLKHPLLEVRIAATDVCCNIVLEMSPMRDDLQTLDIIKTLIQHARESEMALRFSSLWALKHVVMNNSREVKIQTLEELGVGWLVSAIQGRQHDSMDVSGTGGVTVNSGSGLSAPNAAGEQVDLLNPSDMDVDDPPSLDGGVDDDEDGEVMFDEASMTHYKASHLRSTIHHSGALEQTSFDSQQYLASIKDLEQNVTLRTRQNNIACQEQALDFVRNLLAGEDCAYMIEHLRTQIGTAQFFTMLTDKLSPISSQAQPRGANAKLVYGDSNLILATVHIITHLANGSPQQKQLVIAQKHLLSSWLPHFSHPDRRIRLQSLWAVNSLTWVEDDRDRPNARTRVRELRNVRGPGETGSGSGGIIGAVERLRSDTELDVRERVKSAMRQVEGLS